MEANDEGPIKIFSPVNDRTGSYLAKSVLQLDINNVSMMKFMFP